MYLYLNIFILLLIITIFYLKQKSIKEHFGLGRRNPTYKKLKHINNVKGGPNWNYRNKTLTYNPYFKPNRTLKSMIAEMAHDALNDKLKKAPSLIDMRAINKVLRYVRLPPIIKL
tara:strand:- start:488 stop:832 length:345 start_codon:yes stop_codon:yes gene_type:complete